MYILDLLFKIFSVLQLFLLWGSLLCAITLFVRTLRKAIKRVARVKDWIILFLSLVYCAFFAFMKIFHYDAFELITSVVFWIIAITATQYAKYEDRKAGRRWWTE